MSPVDEARALLAIVAENEAAVKEARRALYACPDHKAVRWSSATERRFRELDAAQVNCGHATDALDAAAPELLARLCAEVDAARETARFQREALARGDRLVAMLEAKAARGEGELAALREHHAAAEAYLAEIGPVREPATAVRGSLAGARIAARERLAAAQHALAAKGEDR